MRKKLIDEKIKKLEEKCEWLESCLNFGIELRHTDFNPYGFYETNIAMEETVNRMIQDGYASDCVFNHTFNVRYFCNNLYRKGYRKIKE